MILSIIIVNYNLAKEIENCINSLLATLANADGIRYEIIVVDNDSPDRQLPQIEKQFPQDFIKFIYSETNLGFGKGCNLGFSNSAGSYICFLNPDTIVQENIFTPLINLLKADESVGIIAPQQQVRKPFFDFSAGYSPKITFEFFNLFGLGVFLEGMLMHFKVKRKSSPVEVNWILGACIVIRSKLFNSLNGFDEDYFMFSEEVDLCRRAKNKGFKILYLPHHKIHHIGSVSGKKDYALYTIRSYSSKYIYINKHFNSLSKGIYKTLLYLQMFSQIFIWTVLFPFKTQKAKQKLNAFTYLLKHRFRYNPN